MYSKENMNLTKTSAVNREFLSENFLLTNKTAENLYHNFAKDLPIIDYHCHLPPEEIEQDKKFKNITEVWLKGDHYKWRAMRTNGVDEKYITGETSDWEKFLAWAKTVPHTLRNPLYHWTHMELKNPFGLSGTLLNGETAKEVWEHCNKLLQSDNFSTRGLLKHFNVKVVCTTDDPLDSLENHKKIKEDKFEVKILPAFRPDKGMAVDNLSIFKNWFDKLQKITNTSISNFRQYIEAIRKRHDYFHENGCRLSDHGLEEPYSENFTDAEINSIFEKILLNKELNKNEVIKFKSAMMHEFGLMNHEKNWVQQMHLGAIRNINSRMFKNLGPDTGYDSIGDFAMALPLAGYLNKMDSENKLAKTIIYNLNPKDNEVFTSIIGSFQDGTIPGKLQYGSAWWFLDQKDGIEKQLNALSHLGLLSRFIGMLTDSRSFLSYPRHEYFRRILCNMIGEDVEKGFLPDSEELLSPFIKNVCFYNADNYFEFDKVNS
jgi:glucuronate isomerase